MITGQTGVFSIEVYVNDGGFRGCIYNCATNLNLLRTEVHPTKEQANSDLIRLVDEFIRFNPKANIVR